MSLSFSSFIKSKKDKVLDVEALQCSELFCMGNTLLDKSLLKLIERTSHFFFSNKFFLR